MHSRDGDFLCIDIDANVKDIVFLQFLAVEMHLVTLGVARPAQCVRFKSFYLVKIIIVKFFYQNLIPTSFPNGTVW